MLKITLKHELAVNEKLIFNMLLQLIQNDGIQQNLVVGT